MKLRLHHYWRSSASWRVRWALALKGLDCEFTPVNLLTDEAESPAYLALNPSGYVPTLEVSVGAARPQLLVESVAIIEWLEETVPTPALLPRSPFDRAQARMLAELVNSGVQPLQNLNVMALHSSEPAEQKAWCAHWNRRGLTAYSKAIEKCAGAFSTGEKPTFPDLFLIPQVYSALRFEVDVERDFPVLWKIYQNALTTPECHASHPDRFKPNP